MGHLLKWDKGVETQSYRKSQIDVFLTGIEGGLFGFGTETLMEMAGLTGEVFGVDDAAGGHVTILNTAEAINLAAALAMEIGWFFGVKAFGIDRYGLSFGAGMAGGTMGRVGGQLVGNAVAHPSMALPQRVR